jgi:hypothetical protein
VSNLLLEPILEQAEVIRRKRHRLGHASVPPNLDTNFVKLQSTFLHVQNLENGPTIASAALRAYVRGCGRSGPALEYSRTFYG